MQPLNILAKDELQVNSNMDKKTGLAVRTQDMQHSSTDRLEVLGACPTTFQTLNER